MIRSDHTRAAGRGFLALAVTAVLAAACGADGLDAGQGDAVDGDDGGDDGGNGAPIPDECNPLGDGSSCLLPWPSSAYLVEDPATATGVRVALPIEAMPVNVQGAAIDPAPWNRFDGFSPSGALVAAFPQGVAPDGLPSHADPAASLADDSPVVVLNLDSGERLTLFAEVDMNVFQPTARQLLIRPLERMAAGAHYAVAIRQGLQGGDGRPLARPAAFQALLDGTEVDHPRFGRLAGGAEAMFDALEEVGIPRDELVLAWDFVTASDDSLSADLLAMRDKALPAMGEAGASLSFTAEEVEADPARALRLLVGTHDSPNFLTRGEEEDSILRRGQGGAGGAGDPGLPEMEGIYPANFSAIIPACVTSQPLPVPALIFGHGLFGTGLDYVSDDLLQDLANDQCVVILAGDWIGLTSRQIESAVLTATDFNNAQGLSEKLAQAIINFIALEHLVRGPMRQSPLFRFEGQPIIDPTQVFFFGASLGGILGGTFMAYDPFIERGALGVPGGAWSLLIERSYAWAAFSGAAGIAYENLADRQILIALLAWSLERWDPITTARRVLDDPLPGTPAKQLLLYEGLNDCLVSNLATEMFARTLGVPVTAPSVKTPFGFEVAEGPVASGFTIYDEKREPTVPETNTPPSDDNGTHSGVNRNPAVLRQVLGFLRTGQVTNECRAGDAPAACDCAAGACR